MRALLFPGAVPSLVRVIPADRQFRACMPNSDLAASRAKTILIGELMPQHLAVWIR